MELLSQGVVLILSAPSGCGKTTVSNILVRDKSYNIARSVSATTRSPRPGEVEGRDYFFVGEDEFLGACENGEMLEHAKVFGNHYGIPKRFVEERVSRGQNTLLVIDWQGAFKLMEIMRDVVVSVFVLPPSMEELSRRLHGRKSDVCDVQNRLKGAPLEIRHSISYDYVVVNKDPHETAKKIGFILHAEKMKTSRQMNLKEQVEAHFSEGHTH